MSSLLLMIFIISIWSSFLFYDKNLGLSVILFILPLLIFIYRTLLQNNKNINKKGFIFIIPIILLALTYLIFNNLFFRALNPLIIFILFILMYIYTLKPTFNIKELINDIVYITFEPLSRFGNIARLLKLSLEEKIKLSTETKKKLKSLLIVLPITVVILMLLSSADAIFGNIFTNLYSYINKQSISNILSEIIARLVGITILFFYLSATINFLLYNYKKTKTIEKTFSKAKDSYTIKLLLTVLNIIYIIFDIIQIRSLILHHIAMDITYAEYARQGFFQLMFVSFINLVIILISKQFKNKKDKSSTKYINFMNVLMLFLTFIIIVSSFMRMYMYESEYGYSLLRLLVYFTLITETILLIPTIRYIFNPKYNIVKSYLIIITIIYVIINFINVDYIIAYRNLNRYYEKNDIDISYLENDYTDNIDVLLKLYNSTTDEQLKLELKEYFKSLDRDINGFQEFNLSKYNAQKKLKQFID